MRARAYLPNNGDEVQQHARISTLIAATITDLMITTRLITTRRDAAQSSCIRGPRRRTGDCHLAAIDVAAADAPLQIWFIRHGESEINVPGNPRTVPDGGVSYPLTRKGVEQARALAESLSGAPIAKIYSSTHLRAIQTADAVALDHTLTLSLAPEAVGDRLRHGARVHSGHPYGLHRAGA